MITLANAYDPVTFENAADQVGSVHMYADPSGRSTRCGITLAHDHGVVSPTSTKPLCGGCWTSAAMNAR